MDRICPVSTEHFHPDFLISTLKRFNEPETAYWEQMDFSLPQPVVFHYPVHPGTIEAEEIVSYIASNTKKPQRCNILQITRIQNPFLMASYLINKDLLRKEYGPQWVQSKYLLHGTPSENIRDISLHNFDLLSVKRDRYGRGIYFTPDIEFARVFCDEDRVKELVLAYVLQSSVCCGKNKMLVPVKGCDTSMNHTPKNAEVIVKYDDDSYYPAYRIAFTYRF